MHYDNTQVVIDLDAIEKNIDAVREKTGLPIMAIIKADAYGHGAIQVARLLEHKCAFFGVSSMLEAMELRRAGLQTPILILGYTPVAAYPTAIRQGIRPSIFHYEDALALSQAAQDTGLTDVPFHFALDTGMSRIGFQATAAAADQCARIAALSGELSQEELEQKQRQDLERLDVMVNYCKTQSCLRGYILDYFGQEHESFCGNCSNCSTETEERDITDQARMILSCVQRMSAKLGYSLGLTSVVRTLLGSRDKRLLQLGLDKLGSYGMLRKLGKDDLRAMAESLESQGYLETDPVHGGVSLTQKAQGVLFEGKTVSMRLPKAEASAPVSSPVGGEQSPDLLAMLKRLRWKIAMQESVPAYIIFSNATLEDMARKAPTTLEAFAKVNGVGSVKVKRFGEVFVDAIADYLQEHGG